MYVIFILDEVDKELMRPDGSCSVDIHIYIVDPDKLTHTFHQVLTLCVLENFARFVLAARFSLNPFFRDFLLRTL